MPDPKPSASSRILAEPDSRATRLVQPILGVLLAVALSGGIAVMVLPPAASVAPIVGLACKVAGLICALATSVYCLRILRGIGDGAVGRIWIDDGTLFVRTPHLDRLPLEHPLRAEIVRRRSIFGAYDELVIHNARDAKLAVTTFYCDQSASVLRDALIGNDSAQSPGRSRPWG